MIETLGPENRFSPRSQNIIDTHNSFHITNNVNHINQFNQQQPQQQQQQQQNLKNSTNLRFVSPYSIQTSNMAGLTVNGNLISNLSND
jgi:hypothetical protein